MKRRLNETIEYGSFIPKKTLPVGRRTRKSKRVSSLLKSAITSSYTRRDGLDKMSVKCVYTGATRLDRAANLLYCRRIGTNVEYNVVRNIEKLPAPRRPARIFGSSGNISKIGYYVFGTAVNETEYAKTPSSDSAVRTYARIYPLSSRKQFFRRIYLRAYVPPHNRCSWVVNRASANDGETQRRKFYRI